MSLLSRFAQSVGLEGTDPVNIPRTPLENGAISTGLSIFFGIAAAVAVLFIGISALKMVISRGNSQEMAKQRDSIIYAVIGLVISMAAFSIVTFVINKV